MAISSIGNLNSYVTQTQGYFTSDGALLKYMTSLSEQKKSISQNSSSYFNESLFSQLGKVNSTATSLQSQISRMASLNQYSSSVGKEASYTDKDVLSANVAKNAVVSSVTKTNVDVTQLASVQQNKSAELNADENSFGDQFNISITDSQGKTTAFNVSLASADNNKSALQSMADKINASNTGFKATLAEDKDNGTVSLQVSGSKTGAVDGKFTINDSSGANLSNVDAESKNAQYSVNGVGYNSQSNDVKLMEGVTAKLNKTGSTQISYNPDMSSAVESAKNFLNTFNNLKEAASGSQALSRQLTEVAGNFSRALGYSGIGQDSKGNFTVTDEKKLSQAISDGSFAKNFQGVSSFGNRLNDVARNAYKSAYTSAVQENFKTLMENTLKPSSINNYWPSGLSLTSGLLFNMLA